ncbi:MAG TPA: translation initiation factor IF-1 [Methylomirabilota bacterium]|nr:translation initiation factor IF-1 [Methylomirabilota bacterium]
MSRPDFITVEGTVIEALPNMLFRVELPNGHRLLAHTSGKVRLHFVKLAAGDKVTVELSPFDLSKGSIALPQEKLKHESPRIS